jgi:hypothetical protein
MFRSSRLIALPLLATALLAAGCGSSQKQLLTQREATRLERTLEQARRAAEAGQCQEAAQLADKGSRQAQNLPSRVDPDLQRNLVDGFEHLRTTIEDECAKPQETPTPSPTATETPAETPSPTPSPTPTETPAETPTPAPTVVPSITPDTGGAGSGDGTPAAGNGGDESQVQG